MKRLTIALLAIFCAFRSGAQGVVRFDFNLYTDSLKKGFYNYINIDAQLADGTWRPLDSSRVHFTCNGGRFRGNDLFIDSSYKADSVLVRAVLRSDPSRYVERVIYIRRRGFDPLPTEREVLDNRRKKN